MVAEHAHRAAPGIEPGTSRTRSENHATRPSSHWMIAEKRAPQRSAQKWRAAAAPAAGHRTPAVCRPAAHACVWRHKPWCPLSPEVCQCATRRKTGTRTQPHTPYGWHPCVAVCPTPVRAVPPLAQRRTNCAGGEATLRHPWSSAHVWSTAPHHRRAASRHWRAHHAHAKGCSGN